MSSHQVIRLGKRWALKTTFTPDFKTKVLPLCRQLPKRRFDGNNKVWVFEAEGDNALSAVEILRKLNVEVPSEILSQARALAEGMDAEGQVAEERIKGKALYAYQVEGVQTLSRMRSFLLADDPGLGKTVQAIMSIPEGSPVICVVPASLKGNWRNEFNLWRPDEFKISILKGRNSFRFPEPGEVVIVNWDILPKQGNDPENVPADFLKQAPEGLVVIGDEIHQAKNSKTQRSRRYTTLNRIARLRKGWTWGLTGTPLMNRPPELWALLESLGLADKAFGTFQNFYHHFNAKNNGYGTDWGLPDEEVPEMLSKVWLRREKTTVLPELPPKRWQNIPVELPRGETRNALDQLLKDINSGKVATLSNGLPGFEEMSQQRKALAEAKIPTLLDMVQAYEDSETPLVVFSAHTSPIKTLGQREGWEIIYGDTSSEERTRIVESFQAGQLKGLAATIKAGGVGITLTHASHMIFVDLEWVPALNTQAEDRLCRIGQDAPEGCLYQILVADHPVDQLLLEALHIKEQLVSKTVQSCSSRVAQGAATLLEGVKETKVAAQKTVPCLLCNDDLVPRVSKSERNPEREYVSCKKCNFFRWVDEDKEIETAPCSHCKRTCIAKTVQKEGRNKGRKFIDCPCCGFVWLTARPKKLSRSEEVVQGKRDYRSNGNGEPPRREAYTEEQKAEMVADLHTLLSVCDGASKKDYSGFSAPDAPIARQYAEALGNSEDVNWTGLYDMLARYRRTQLGKE